MVIEQVREKTEQTGEDSRTDRVDSANESNPTVPGSEQPEPDRDRGPAGCSGKQDTDEQPAWAVLESGVLDGDRFLLVRDDLFTDEELQDRVTDKAREQVDAVYRMTEMNSITAAELSDEDKRDLHELKKRFGGRVLGEDLAAGRVPFEDIGDWVDSRTG